MAVVQMTLHYLHLPKSSAKDHHRLQPAVGQNHRLARKQGRTAEEPEWELGMGGAGLGCCGRALRKLWDRETSSGLGVVSAAGLGETGTN